MMLHQLAAAEVPNPTEYIAHHITFLTNVQPHGIVDFSVINLDSVFFSIALALLFCGGFYIAARKATSGLPGRFQNAIELIVEQVNTMVTDAFHGKSRLIAPL